MEEKGRYPRLRLKLMIGPGLWIGPGKADLLEGIAATGSISAAGRRMGMSYKRAWGLVEILNAMFDAPLVAASRGGAGRGGAALTACGAEVLALYRRMEAESSRASVAEIAAIAALHAAAAREK
ncbi:LysR family transcriptional regulator [Frigidibacter sp. RF13]|uniref:winged helix-turn-helix domain-containing protein n=1 Tax=Frigidibacter sp. RF13 TaxID=2997340 RepID=UPI0022712E9E|nr:LysR family transcriptional regulator [Frigidibacter sp. RF13]MCY1127158.1 LysR family transcriptional regulator [Frigidibacter sp. RF13]